jgi:hypothetical protein
VGVALALMAALLLVVPASAAACGEEGGEDTGPLIPSAQSTPGSFTYEGGTVTVTARVEDDCGIQQVYAEVSSTGGTYLSVQMLPYEVISSTAIVYRGEFQVPPNYEEWAISYGIEVSAEDTNGAFAARVAGETEVAGLPPFDEAPYVSEASVAPSVLGSEGGTVRIGVTASDTRGITNAYAIVTYPDGSEKEVWLEPISFSRFESPLQVPANLGVAPQAYSVAVFAEDDIGQTTGESAGTVTVEPKGAPSPGWLSLKPGDRRFGHVKIDTTRWRSIILKNTGKPGSPPVSGFLRTSGLPFYLPGAGPDGAPFTLAPGEQRKFDIGFKPTATGQQAGRLTVVRSDQAQPQLGMPLFGTGIK